MEDWQQQETQQHAPQGKFSFMHGSFIRNVMHRADYAMDIIEEDWNIIKREGDIFGGALIFLIGLLDFHSGRYCDGNTADYLSCTRPVTYYYYTWLEILFIMVGVGFILLWCMKRQRHRSN